jgi:metal-responsive CopG/Arc/MetJ family transcriptional regulator
MAKPLGHQLKNINVLLEEKMLEEIDEYRWRNRLPSRTAAIRELIASGLHQSPKPSVRSTRNIGG